MTICKQCLEKSWKDLNKIYQLFASIPHKSYFRDTSKYDTSDSKEGTYHGVPLQQMWIM